MSTMRVSRRRHASARPRSWSPSRFDELVKGTLLAGVFVSQSLSQAPISQDALGGPHAPELHDVLQVSRSMGSRAWKTAARRLVRVRRARKNWQAHWQV